MNRNLLPLLRLSIITIFFQIISLNSVHAQYTDNLLSNGSFETPAMSIFNLNNLIGAGLLWGDWKCTNGGFNILHVLGSGYHSGANRAADGDQYVDVANSDGWISQSFTLDHDSPIFFSGAFSAREAGWSNWVNWTAKVQIVDSTGAIVAATPTRDFVTTDNMEDWYELTGSTSRFRPEHIPIRPMPVIPVTSIRPSSPRSRVPSCR